MLIHPEVIGRLHWLRQFAALDFVLLDFLLQFAPTGFEPPLQVVRRGGGGSFVGPEPGLGSVLAVRQDPRGFVRHDLWMGKCFMYSGILKYGYGTLKCIRFNSLDIITKIDFIKGYFDI